MPFKRSCVAAQPAADGKIYVIGGHSPVSGIPSWDETDAVQAYDPLTDTWESKAPLPSRRARAASTIGTDGKIYVMGGVVNMNSTELKLTKADRYDPATDTWESLPDLSTARKWPAAAAAFNNNVYLIGGLGYDHITGMRDISNIEILTPGASVWEYGPSLRIRRSYLGATTASDGKIYAIGGMIFLRYDPPAYLDYVEVYDPANVYFTPVTFASTVIDIGRNAAWDSIEWTADTPGGTSVEVQTRTSEDGTNWSAWSTPSSQSGSQITSPPGRFIQYKVTLIATDASLTPKVSDITVNYNSAPGQPVPTKPSSEHISSKTPRLTWKNADELEGEDLIYTVQLDTTAAFDSPNLRTYTGIAQSPGATSFKVPASAGLSNGTTWYWRVVANDGQIDGPWSAPKMFTVDQLPPVLSDTFARPDPFSPGINGKKDKTTIYFNLSEEADATAKLYNSANSLVKPLSFKGQPPNLWSRQASLDYGRLGAEAIKLPDNRILLIGGTLSNNQAALIPLIYDPKTGETQEQSPMPISAFRPAIAQGPDGLVYVIGGGKPQASTIVQTYDPQTDTWTRGPSLPQGITEGKAEILDGKIYVFGYRPNVYKWNLVQKLDMNTMQWATADAPIESMAFDPVAFDGKLYIIGGQISTQGPTDKVQIYDPVGDTWKEGTRMPIRRGFVTTVNGNDGFIYTIGGYEPSIPYSRRFDIFDPTENRWIAKTLLPIARGHASAILVDNYIYTLGGRNDNSATSSDVFRYLTSNVANGGQKQLDWDGHATDKTMVPNGTYTYRIKATDGAGNTSLEKVGTITVDNTPPEIDAISADSVLEEPGQPTLLKFAVTGEPTKVTAAVDTIPTSLVGPNPDGVFTAALYNLPAGNHTLVVEAEDRAGNKSIRERDAISPGLMQPSFWQQTSRAQFEGGQLNGIDALSRPGYLELPSPSWQRQSDMPFALSGAIVAVDSSQKLHILGSLSNLNVHKVYDPVTDLWQSKSLMPYQRYQFGAVRGSDDRIYILGGRFPYYSQGTVISQTYNPATDSWGHIPNMPVGTYRNGAVAIGDNIYVVGNRDWRGDVWIQKYNVSTRTWTNFGRAPFARTGFSVAASGNKVYVIGGSTSSGGKTGQTDVFDINSNTWQSAASMPTPREWAGVTTDANGRIWIIGGLASSGPVNKVEFFDPTNNAWSTSINAPVRRSFTSATFIGDTLYSLSGQNTFGRDKKVYSLKLASAGSITSSVFDASDTVSWQKVGFTATLPPSTSAKVATRSSTDSVNWSSWSAWYGTSGATVTSPPGRYLQYRAELGAQTLGASPIFSDIAVSYRQLKPMPPVLEAPADNDELSVSEPTFSWQNSEHAPGSTYTYRLQIDRAPTFDSNELRDTSSIPEGLLSTNFTIPLHDRLSDGAWYWRVAADDGSEQSDWTTMRTFTVSAKPDLAITSADISISPGLVSEPETATISANLRNLGAESPGFTVNFYDGDPASNGQLLATQKVGPLASGGQTTVETTFDSYNQAGDHQIYVVADPDNTIDERLETNNRASSDLIVAAHGLSLDMSLDKNTAGADETIAVDLLAANNGIAVHDARLHLTLLDDNGVLVATISDQTLSDFNPMDIQVLFGTFNTGHTYAGAYQVKAELTVDGRVLTADAKPLVIEPDISLDFKAVADKLDYNAGEDVAIIARLVSKSANFIFRDTTLSVSLTDPAGQTVLADEYHIDQLLPDELKSSAVTWNTGQNYPGIYNANVVLASSDRSTVATADTSFTILSTAETGAGLSGDLTVTPASVTRWGAASAEVLLTNSGNSQVDFTAEVIVADPQTGDSLKEFSFPVALAAGETTSTTFDYPFVDLPEDKTYVAILRAQLPSRDVLLDHASLTVEKPLDLSVTTTGDTQPRVLVWAKTQAQADLAKTSLERAGAFYRIIEGEHNEHDDDDDKDKRCKRDERDDDNEDRKHNKYRDGHDDEDDSHDEHGRDQFVSAMRSGVFNQYWIIGDSHPLSARVGQELIERVNAGATVLAAGVETASKLFHDEHSDDDNLFGLKADGKLKKSTYTADLFNGVISDTATVTFSGKLRKLELESARSIGAVTVTKRNKESTYPIGAINEYGLGRAVTIGFDPTTVEAADIPTISSILEKTATRFLASEDQTLPYAVVPIKVDLTSLGAAARLKAKATLPTNILPLYARDGIVGTDSVAFTLDLAADETRTLDFAVRLPKESGVSTITVTVDYFSPETGVFEPYETTAVTVTVVKDLPTLQAETEALLNALVLGKRDRKRIKKIKKLVAHAVNGKADDDDHDDDHDDAKEPIKSMLKALSILNKIDADTNDIRLSLDRILFVLEVDQTFVNQRETDDD